MRVLDVFSGIGAMSLGLEWAGMRTVGFCEIEPACRFWLRQHWPNEPIFEDVRTLTGEVVRERCGAVDLVAGGFPCVDISTAGKGAGIEGDQSRLWFELLRLVREVRPRWVLVENVPALRTRGADVVLSGLEAEGYACWPFVVGADDAGAPHRRKRVWIVAYSGKCGRLSGLAEAHAGQPDAARRGVGLADTDGAGLARERGRGVHDGERAACGHDADGCGERAVGDADNLLASQQPRWRGGESGPSTPEPGGAGATLGDADPDGPALGGGEPQEARGSSAARRASDPTRERGVVARPGEPQHEWEAPRLADANGNVGGRGPRCEELLGDGSQSERNEGYRGPVGHGEAQDRDARQPESGMGGAAHGAARRMARTRSAARRARLRAIGNAVYPQTVEALGRAIIAAESVMP